MEDELAVMQSIYCKDGELDVHYYDKDCCSFTVYIIPEGFESTVSVRFTLKDGYPEEVPALLIQSNELEARDCRLLEQAALENIGSLSSVYDVTEWIKENAKVYRQSHSQDDVLEDRWLAAVQLDHMNSPNKYIKSLETWASELSICGALLLCPKAIVYVLQSEKSNVKNFLVKHRTEMIDIDTRGRPCKERKMSVLWEGPTACDLQPPLQGPFQTVNVSSWENLKDLFATSNLEFICESIRSS